MIDVCVCELLDGFGVMLEVVKHVFALLVEEHLPPIPTVLIEDDDRAADNEGDADSRSGDGLLFFGHFSAFRSRGSL